MSTTWLIEDGLSLIRSLQPRAREFGFHIALGGGVLNKGYSDKDLDLYFLSLSSTKFPKGNYEALLEWLTNLWGSPTPIPSYEEDKLDWKIYKGEDGKFHMSRKAVNTDVPSIYTYKLKYLRAAGDRIDVFIL